MSCGQVRSNTSINSYIEFPATFGIQAGRAQYATVWTIGMLMRIVDEPLTRILLNEPVDANFIRSLSAKLSEAAEQTVTQAFVLGVLGQIEFIPATECTSLGKLRMDPTSHVEILDGVHRLAALRRASAYIKKAASLTVPVLLTPVCTDTEFAERRTDLSRSRTAIRNNARERHIQKSLHRHIVRDSIGLSVFLASAVDLKNTTVALRSKRLFTLSTFARACRPLFEKTADLSPQVVAQQLADYWENLATLITPWRRFRDNEISGFELRQKSILGLSSTLGGLALLGARLIHEKPLIQKRLLEPLSTLDWQKDAKVWNSITDGEGRPLKGNQAADSIYRVLRSACASDREPQGASKPPSSASAPVPFWNRESSA